MPRNMIQGAKGCDTEPYGKENFYGNGRIFSIIAEVLPRHKGNLAPV